MSEFLVPQRQTLARRESTLDEILPPGHLVRFVWRVLESFDFSELEGAYASVQGGPGRPPYHPRVLGALWIYGMTEGIETAAEIARASTTREDFRWLAGGLAPCDQTLLNFLTVAQEGLVSIWEQVLKAMHQAGHVDLSALAEDGTKLRANASKRSFHTADDIAQVIEDLKAGLAKKLSEIVPPQASSKHQAQVRGLSDRLRRAQQASQELQDRLARRAQAKSRSAPTGSRKELSADPHHIPARRQTPGKFGRDDFRHEPDRDVWICPAGQELRFVGVYPTDNGSGAYRLYRRCDCGGCALKDKCTGTKGRSLKVPVVAAANRAASQASAPESTPPSATPAAAEPVPQAEPAAQDEDSAGGPRASLTEPEAVLMLATSEKRFEPSYNADFTVTRHGVVVSQFLTKCPVDFDHFRRALPFVLVVLGRPDAWAGDGHYSTLANLLLAHQAGVTLYAPLEEPDLLPTRKFPLGAFRHDPEKDLLVCPAGQQLVKVGTYGEKQGRPYDLYARPDCAGCALKSRCTDARGRRVRRYHGQELIEALQARMTEVGEKVRQFRSQTVEPVNGQVKQHGLGRFHVRGLSRCAVVLTLASIAHNLMKWKAREAARALSLAG